MVYLFAIAALGFLFYRLLHAGIVFQIVLKKGRVISCSGRAPQRLKREFEEVLKRSRVQEGNIKIVVRQQAPALRASKNINPDVVQMLRNILGQFRLAELQSAPRISKKR